MATANQIEMQNSGFRYQNSIIPYKDVYSLRYIYIATKKTFNFVPAGTDYEAILDIYVSTLSQPISVRSSWLNVLFDINQSEEEAHRVVSIYQTLAKRTYQVRLAKYVNRLEKQGYIDYDNKQILKSGIVKFGKRELKLTRSIELLRTAFEIVQPTRPSAAKTFKEVLFGIRENLVISTQFDSDVLLNIFETYFGLKWDTDGKCAADDIHTTTTITRLQAKLGARVEIEVPRYQLCESCKGRNSSQCAACNGMKLVSQTYRFRMPISPGISDGKVLRLKGRGHSRINSNTSGDLHIHVSIGPTK